VRSREADGLWQVEEILPLLLARPLACDLAQHADELAAVGWRELLKLEGKVFLLLYGGVRNQSGFDPRSGYAATNYTDVIR
jgi:hypothetical protein